MAIPKKGTRKITVKNLEFIWLIRRKVTYSQADYGVGKLHVAIELKENSGMSLIICTDRKHPKDIGAEIVNPITPSDISNWIKQAFELGWNPSKNGKQFLTKIVNKKMQRYSV